MKEEEEKCEIVGEGSFASLLIIMCEELFNIFT